MISLSRFAAFLVKHQSHTVHERLLARSVCHVNRISVARVDDRLYAFDDLCTCTDEACSLSGGLLRGTAIMCHCHGSRFDITTGAVINGPATETLNVYEAQEIEGSIQIRLHRHESGRG